MIKYLFPLFFETPGDKTGTAPVVVLDNKTTGDSDEDLLGEGNNDDKPLKKTKEKDEAGADKDGEDDDKEPDEEEIPDEDDKENEDEEEELDEEGNPKEKEPKEKEDEEEEDLVRHSYASIKKEYPEFFKKFPGLKQAFFREQEFTKIFPSVDDAKNAVQAQENFESVREVVMNGDAETFLNQVKTASPDAVAKFAGNFLSDLRKVDKDVYIEVTTPVIRNILQQAVREATDDKDDNLIAACKVVHKAIFGGGYDDISKEVKTAAREEKDNPEKDKFNKERQEFYEQKYNSLRTGIWSEVESSLTREIERGLDPTNSIRPGLKKLLVEKIFNEVTGKVASDQAHVGRMNELWKREAKAGYNGGLKDSIKTTYLSRARAIMPAIRARVRAEGVGQQKAGDKEVKDKVDKNNRDKTPAVGRQASSGKKNATAKELNKAGTSDLDFLSS